MVFTLMICVYRYTYLFGRDQYRKRRYQKALGSQQFSKNRHPRLSPQNLDKKKEPQGLPINQEITTALGIH